jgi:hypothetical protein
MRNSIVAALAMIALVAAAQAESSYGLPALAPSGQPVARQASPEKILTVPAQTEAAVQLLSGIHSQVSHVGDPIRAQLLQPVYVNGRVALPRGSLLDGCITRIRPAGRLRRPAELSLRFERITLPDGQDRPIAAILTALDAPAPLSVRLDSEGQLKGSKPVSWKRLAAGLAGLGALASLETQLAGAAVLGATLPLGGAAVLGYALLWPRGSDVHLPPETRFRIRLHHPLTVRVAWYVQQSPS